VSAECPTVAAVEVADYQAACTATDDRESLENRIIAWDYLRQRGRALSPQRQTVRGLAEVAIRRELAALGEFPAGGLIYALIDGKVRGRLPS
jgi:hypothetical protein